MTNTAQGNENLMVLLSNITSHMSKTLERWHLFPWTWLHGETNIWLFDVFLRKSTILTEFTGKGCEFPARVGCFFLPAFYGQLQSKSLVSRNFLIFFHVRSKMFLNSSKTCQFVNYCIYYRMAKILAQLGVFLCSCTAQRTPRNVEGDIHKYPLINPRRFHFRRFVCGRCKDFLVEVYRWLRPDSHNESPKENISVTKRVETNSIHPNQSNVFALC